MFWRYTNRDDSHRFTNKHFAYVSGTRGLCTSILWNPHEFEASETKHGKES